jgi:hypothetical protein
MEKWENCHQGKYLILLTVFSLGLCACSGKDNGYWVEDSPVITDFLVLEKDTNKIYFGTEKEDAYSESGLADFDGVRYRAKFGEHHHSSDGSYGVKTSFTGSSAETYGFDCASLDGVGAVYSVNEILPLAQESFRSVSRYYYRQSISTLYAPLSLPALLANESFTQLCQRVLSDEGYASLGKATQCYFAIGSERVDDFLAFGVGSPTGETEADRGFLLKIDLSVSF